MASTVLNPSGQLGQNSFLQLMMQQMQNQDPLQPQDSSQFLAQLAQFTSVEQITNVAQEETQSNQTLQSLVSLTQSTFEHQLIGTNVQLTDSTGSNIAGTVSAIKYVNQEPNVVVNGQSYPLSTLTEME
jgi:flagellar basal-body rod modification protein FlgD